MHNETNCLCFNIRLEFSKDFQDCVTYRNVYYFWNKSVLEKNSRLFNICSKKMHQIFKKGLPSFWIITLNIYALRKFVNFWFSIFEKYFNFWESFQFLRKISIFRKNLSRKKKLKKINCKKNGENKLRALSPGCGPITARNSILYY